MASLVNQTNFSFGEVDPVLLQATDEPDYLKALSKCKNVYVNARRSLSKRPGSSFSFSSNLIQDDLNKGIKRISYSNGENKWITAVMYLSDSTVELKIYLRSWADNTEHLLSFPLTQANNTIDQFSIDASDEFIVIANSKYNPLEIKVDFEDISLSTITPIKFSVVPSIDTGNIDYSKYEFGVSGVPLGSTITITNIPPGDENSFDALYVGGLVISRFGASIESPLGIAIITSITQPGTSQIINTIVVSPFDNDGKDSTGSAWSVRRPVWGTGIGFPKLCSFHGGRLYLVGTEKYPSLICGSRINTYNDFNAAEGNGVDPIIYLMQEPKGGSVTHVFGGLNLNIWTKENQYIAWSGLDVGLTPKNFFPRSVSSFTISKNDPLRYKDETYFVTSDGKNIIQLSETYQDANTVDISFASKHLVNNPVRSAISILPGLEEQLVFFINEDKSVFLYSASKSTGVSAFSSVEFIYPEGYELSTIENIDNEVYIALFNNTKKDFVFFKILDNLYLDYSSPLTMSGGTGTVNSIYSVGDKLALTSVSGSTISYFGEFIVGAANVITADVPDGEYTVGLLYSVDIASMNNISSPQNIFFKNKKFKDYVSFYQSYDLSINGKPHALSSIAKIQDPGVVLQTGFAILGNSNGYRNEQEITVKQSSPYPCNIQSMGYMVKGASIT